MRKSCHFFKESLNIDASVNRFLDEVTNQMHIYIHHPDFRRSLLEDLKTSWRLKVGFDVNDRIEKQTKIWEDSYVKQIYQDTFVNNLDKELRCICGPLADTLMRGFKIPFFVDNKILKLIFPNAVAIAGGFAMRVFLLQPKVAFSVAATGVVLSGLVTFGYIDKFETVCEKAVDVRIENISKTKIKISLKKRFATAIKRNMSYGLRKMKVEIERLTEESFIADSAMHSYMKIGDKLFNCQKDIQKIDKKCSSFLIDGHLNQCRIILYDVSIFTKINIAGE